MSLGARGDAPPWLDVSRETLDKLAAHLALVEKWNPAINLVAAKGLPEAWTRHVLDSAQLFALIPEGARTLADFGSGAGFPGLVLAILAQGTGRSMSVTLVESDRRKATFLSQAARSLGLYVQVRTERVEALAPLNADVVTARAFAPLVDLCGFALRHLTPDGTAIFPKGAQAEAERDKAAMAWRFQAESVPSRTDPLAEIVIIKQLAHA